MAEFNVIVIGSGVAGALVAWRLATEGARVLVLEAGEVGRSRVEMVGLYASALYKTPHSPYRSAENDRLVPSPDGPTDYYVQPQGPDQFKSTYERRVGGSTSHWLGHTPRLLPNDFRMKTEYGVGVDWPITYNELEPWYCAAERALGVAGDDAEWDAVFGAYRSQPFPMARIWPSYSDLKVTEALQGRAFEGVELVVRSTPSARNSQPYDGRPVCAGNSTCVPICPIQAKYDATVHTRKAEEAGAVLQPASVVTRLEVGEGNLIRSVIYRSWDGQEHAVSAPLVVLAAHAIESPRILLMSGSGGVSSLGGASGSGGKSDSGGIANSSGQVGRNLMDHLQKAAFADAPFPLYPFRGPPSTSGIEELRDGPFRSRRSAVRVSLNNDGRSRDRGSPYKDLFDLVTGGGAAGVALFGEDLKRRLAEIVQPQLRLSCSTEVLPNPENRVTLSDRVDALGLPRPQIVFRCDEYTRGGFRHALDAFAFIFGALEATNTVYESDLHAYNGAGHIMGTCRMGDDPASSVVDSQCRAHDHPNLFVVGSAVFPTCGTPNPTLTVAALALRAADAIRKQLAGNLVTHQTVSRA